MWLLFQLDGMLFGFLSLSSSSVFQLGFGSGRTFFKFPNIAKPCSIEIAQLLESKPKEIKIDVPLSIFFHQALSDLQIRVLDITPEHAQRFYEIQMIKDHKDQYDRTIIAQAASTGFTVLSDDSKFPFYPIELISNNL